MDDKNDKSQAETPLLKGIKKITTVPKITPIARKDSEARKLAYVEFAGTSGGHGGSHSNSQLDLEMEKVFKDDKFDLAQITSSHSSASLAKKQFEDITTPHFKKISESDYDSHRKTQYHHPHHTHATPTKRLAMKQSDKSDKHAAAERGSGPTGSEQRDDDDQNSTPGDETPLSTAPTSPLSNTSSSYKSGTLTDDATTAVNLAQGGVDNGEPQISERAAYGEQMELLDTSKKVQFDNKRPNDKKFVIGSFPLGSDDQDDDELYINSERDRQRRKARHTHKSRKYSLQEGSEKGQRSPSIDITHRKVSIQPEDAELEEADIDELTSHRSDDPRGMRRARTSHVAAPAIQHEGAVLSPCGYKKHLDHSPHEIFVQLDELIGIGEEREWKETARWIKYEEDVEEGADRWGRPHVASLSFHSLLNLRKCLETGVVLLDLDEKDLPGIAYRVVEQMVIDELITEDDKPTLLRALLLRHRHVNEHSHGTFNFGLKKKYSSYSSLTTLNCQNTQNSVKKESLVFFSQNALNVSPESRKVSVMGDRKISQASDMLNWRSSSHNDTRIDIKEETYTSSQEDLKRMQGDSIMKRIPRGAEATTVLVGAVDFLEQPTIAFVRLATGISLPGITEVPIPVRFLFILLGPKMMDIDYHEVGRSISTLMSNAHFHDIAYKAEDRREILSAINEFLDESIVLPPGKWEKKNLLAFDELRAKSEMIRTRKKKAIEQKSKLSMTSDEEKKLIMEKEEKDKKPFKNPLEKTNKPWGGLINDIKRRLPMYKSDVVDGFNSETLAATIFMYFAALSTAITFGGLASDKTDNQIGISETLISTSFVGMIFHSLAGQPLVIIGTTGPLLLFDEALRKFCKENSFDFLPVRLYVGIWLTIIAIVVSAFEGSVYVRLFTRFTQEIFSALITLIYIVETVMKLILIYKRHPLMSEYNYLPELSSNGNATTHVEDNFLDARDENGHPINQPNTALFCTILTLGTFAVAYYLKLFRNSHFFGRNARRALGDFGVPISITIFVLVNLLVPQVYTEKLVVPEGISPTNPERSWLVPFGPVPTWLPFAAIVPSLLVYILIFMETHISELIVDKPERGLKKGSGLHWDIVLLCILNTICGFLGMPWHCAATVRSVTHVSAVTIMSRTHAPGESPHIEEVKEQRLSGILVSLMIGLSVLMAPVLRQVPMSVLFGVFLYMGIASMSGVQFFDRLSLVLMPVKHHPQTNYARRVPTWKMHLFTLVQVISLTVLWVVKSSQFSLAFPFFLLMMVPLRQRLDRFYTQQELRALDGAQPKDDSEDEPDFYEQAPIPA
ncbi:anion exchange protein 3 isoform X2 [Culicoides brevitarsis]|uniref:anion exchange protein 3 isoform X2 n=1 Tax=Culicoides brevitarsis TaxID=469753 RepID=UPI00307B1B8A